MQPLLLLPAPAMPLTLPFPYKLPAGTSIRPLRMGECLLEASRHRPFIVGDEFVLILLQGASISLVTAILLLLESFMLLRECPGPPEMDIRDGKWSCMKPT